METADALRMLRRLCDHRHEAGAKARGRSLADPFLGDPVNELLEELADAINYLTEVADRKMFPLWVINQLSHNITEAAVLVLCAERTKAE